MRIPPRAPNRLLVEGTDDKYTVINLMKEHGVDWEEETAPRWVPHVEDCQNDVRLLEAIPLALKRYDSLGIVIDADLEPENRFAQLQNLLERNSVSIPPEPKTDGIVVQGFSPRKRIGIWIMPDNRHPGRLEDFLADLVRANDPCWGFANEVVAAAKTKGAKYPEKDREKAHIHTWLAWQEKPGLPFGTALNARFFDAHCDAGERFATWFRSVFAPSD